MRSVVSQVISSFSRFQGLRIRTQAIVRVKSRVKVKVQYIADGLTLRYYGVHRVSVLQFLPPDSKPSVLLLDCQ